MNEYLGGLRSKVEAEKIRDLLIKRYRLWIPGGLEMVSKSLTVEPTPEMNRTKTDSYPWRIVHSPQVRETLTETYTWRIENFAERALEFYQGYLLGCRESSANKGRKKNARTR